MHRRKKTVRIKDKEVKIIFILNGKTELELLKKQRFIAKINSIVKLKIRRLVIYSKSFRVKYEVE